MYRKSQPNQMTFEFYHPFGGKLQADNRWVVLAGLIPWDSVEQVYTESFKDSYTGCPAIPSRIAFGALIIKERQGLTDRETVQQIKESPYLQYFIGFREYNDEEDPFHHTEMTHFRRRFSKEALADINEQIIQNTIEKDQSEPTESDDDNLDQPPENKGKLIIDATCTPADITFPTDLKILNAAREKTEEIIDCMHQRFIGLRPKPRTYRIRARKDFLALAKKKKHRKNALRKAIRKQLGYLRRNLKTIETMKDEGLLYCLGKRLYRLLLVSQEVYRQQHWMYENKSHSIPDRIVSLYQPHVRPIVRGKAQAPTEFGAKISVSLVEGFASVDVLSWDPYNETGDLESQVERYHRRYGYYPESVHADQIYRSRDNRRYCKQHGIRLSGPPLGRPREMTDENKQEIRKIKRQRRQDELDRNAVEGKFGQGKRRFGLSRIMAKLWDTSECMIMVSFLVMNLEKLLKEAFLPVFFQLRTGYRVICCRLDVRLARLRSHSVGRIEWRKLAG